MQFHLRLNTSHAASFQLAKGFPAHANVLDTEFELPYGWTREQCVAALVTYLGDYKMMIYQNLVTYEEYVGAAQEAFDTAVKHLSEVDFEQRVNFSYTRTIGQFGGHVTLVVTEIGSV